METVGWPTVGSRPPMVAEEKGEKKPPTVAEEKKVKKKRGKTKIVKKYEFDLPTK